MTQNEFLIIFKYERNGAPRQLSDVVYSLAAALRSEGCHLLRRNPSQNSAAVFEELSPRGMSSLYVAVMGRNSGPRDASQR